MLIVPLCAIKAQKTDSGTQLAELQRRFDQFASRNPQERVYLHFDNTSYFKGEHIWYKAYVVNDETLKASDMSQILYVELVNALGYPVETQKLMLRNGQTSGSFLLKDTLNAGFYEVRAYTAWMLNFAHGNGHGWERMQSVQDRDYFAERFLHYLKGNAGIFSRVFPVYEPVDNHQYDKKQMPLPARLNTLKDKNDGKKLLIDFYPEGGNLVRDVPTRVAFQAHTQEGRAVDIQGALVREGKEIGMFKTEHAGRGVFSMTASESDETEEELMRGMKLKVFFNGKDYLFSLPKSNRRGYVLNVFSSGDAFRATVARNADTPGQLLGINITSRGKTQFSGTVDLRDEKQGNVVVDKASLRTGVNIFTLYNEKGQVLAQRQVFVNNHDMGGMHLQMKTPEEAEGGMRPYEKMTLQCQVTDTEGNPVKGRNKFSIAVTDGQYRDSTYADGNMLTYLLLSSEVKGFIPHPAYYFEKDDHEHQAALDLLLMVQGWTRYDFERMMSSEKWEPLMAVERGLNFRGRVVENHGEYPNDYLFWKKLEKPLWVYAEYTTPYGGNVEAEIITDSLGFFMFNLNPFFGTGRMTFTVNEESAKNIGHARSGVAGHNFSQWDRSRPWHILSKHIIPFNAYSPVPRDYDYYETKVFDGRISHVPQSEIKPAAVIDVRDMMMYLSNIFGSVNDFHFFGTNHDDAFMLLGKNAHRGGWWHPGAERDHSVQDNFGDDRYFAQMDSIRRKNANVKPLSLTSEEKKKLKSFDNRIQSQQEYDFDQSYMSFGSYGKLLMLYGLDGMNLTTVDHEYLDNPKWVFKKGSKKNLPPGTAFFPPDVNFSQLYVYSDTNDRSLIHQKGRYREVATPYNRGATSSEAHPLTSIFDFKTDSLYSEGMPEPDFYGYRINFLGLSEPDAFYRVDYSREPLPEEADCRRTIYWNPSVVTDEEGRVQVSFYNNSFTKSVVISAEGLTKDGIVIHN